MFSFTQFRRQDSSVGKTVGLMTSYIPLPHEMRLQKILRRFPHICVLRIMIKACKVKKKNIKHFVKLLTMRLVEYNKPDDISKILNYTSDSATVYTNSV